MQLVPERSSHSQGAMERDGPPDMPYSILMLIWDGGPNFPYFEDEVLGYKMKENINGWKSRMLKSCESR